MIRQFIREFIERSRTGKRAAAWRTGTIAIMYHSVSSPSNPSPYLFSTPVNVFKKHMEMFDEIGNFISPTSIVSNNSRSPSRNELNIILTFDDGYRDALEVVAPILERYDAPAAVFVTTNLIESGMESFMSWNDLRELAEYEQITIGSHCRHHWNLTALSSADAKTEVRESKLRIEEEIDTDIMVFSYPSGGYTPELGRIVADTGYELAFIDEPTRNKNLYALGRLGIHKHNQTPNRLSALLATEPAY